MEIRIEIGIGDNLLVEGNEIDDAVAKTLLLEAFKRLKVTSPRIFRHSPQDTHPCDVTNNFPLEVDPSVFPSGQALREDISLSGGNKKSPQKKGVSSGALTTVTADDVVALYNEVATRLKWRRVIKITDEMRKRINIARKQFPNKEDWEAILRGWERHPFFSGSSGQYDKIKIHTMLYKNRFEEFYQDGMDTDSTPPVDDFLASLNAFANYEDPELRAKKIEMGLIKADTQDA